MKVKETRISRGVSPFITKIGVSLISSAITKACTSPFIMKAGMSLIPNIERRVLQRRVLVSYALYKARSQLGKNSGNARSGMFLPCSYRFFSFLGVPSKNFAVMN
jgi:hypothetical protein